MFKLLKTSLLAILCLGLLLNIQVTYNLNTTTTSNNKSDSLKTNSYSNYIHVQNKLSLMDGYNITISGNQNFANQAREKGWLGKGTKEHPFIIEGYSFQSMTNTSSITNLNTAALIEIENVSSYFIIQNNIFDNNKLINNFIYMAGVSNGVIKDNQFYNSYISSNKLNSIILDSYFSPHGIINCSNISIMNNKFISTGNFLVFSFVASLKITSTFNVIIYNNEFEKFPLTILTSLNTTVFGNTFTNSSISALISPVNFSYNVIENSNIGILTSPEQTPTATSRALRIGSIIQHNLFFNNDYGIILSTANIFGRIYINCNSNQYFECQDLPTGYSGLVTLHYSNTIIKNNEFQNNIIKAISIDDYCDNNTIYGNNFSNNNESQNIRGAPTQFTTQVIEGQPQNVTNNWSYKGIGNYWSDYRGGSNTPMNFLENNSDFYPQQIPFNISWIINQPEPNQKDNFLSILRNYALAAELIISVIAISGTVILVVALFVLYKRQTEIDSLNKPKFRDYLRNFFLRDKSNIKSKELLSDKTLEKIEKIIQETTDSK